MTDLLTHPVAGGWRRTKLVCTIGPATVDRVDALVGAGMDVARVNLSHGTPEEHATAVARVREAAAAADRAVAVLVDLAGPKIRLGDLPEGERALVPGEELTLSADGGDGVAVDRPTLPAELDRGDRILLADGAAELRVVDTAPGVIRTEVVRGGLVRSRAGVSVPAERLREPGLTERDRQDVTRAVEIGADLIGQSFVRTAADVAELRRLLPADGPAIVAKIETRPAVDAFDAIAEAADAVMVARGDLGVELPYELVPILQKRLVRRALDRGVPTIVATQMLESMVTAPRPTRAEASDVANAVFDGADAIMLSAETAIGEHPILAAEAAVRIALLCEREGSAHFAPGAPADDSTEPGALAHAAVEIARAGELAAIACYTRTGRTARIIAALRPPVPILAYSPDAAVVRRLALVHGVHPRHCPELAAHDRITALDRLLAGEPGLGTGAPVAIVATTAPPATGRNLLELRRIGQDGP
ncbi:MAG TPA: pyruvate kinase [Candidatus Limnocylindria bacterium]|nr:pyruvate kinase [Candidatus Limnocylindria bacterium]